MGIIERSKIGAEQSGRSTPSLISIGILCLGAMLLFSQTTTVTASEGKGEVSSEEKVLIQPYHLNVAGDVGVQGVLDMGALDLGTGPVPQQIINLANPTAAQDAATMGYVDAAIGAIPEGDITAVNTTGGILGGAAQGEANLSVDTGFVQRRVSQSCATGSSIREIRQDGTVLCETDKVGTGDMTAVYTGAGLSGGGDTGEVTLSLLTPLDLSGDYVAGIIRGKHTTNDNYGRIGSAWEGVFGESASGRGVVGFSSLSEGVLGRNTSNDNYGTLGGLAYGVYGNSKWAAVYGEHSTNGTTGYLGGVGVAVGGFSDSASYYAGYFEGKVRVEGNLRVNGRNTVDVLEIVGGADLSETFRINSQKNELLPGMIVSIDPEHPGELVISDIAYDRHVAGIISGAGGVQPGMRMSQSETLASGDTPVALSGRVYAWTTAPDSPIRPGDLLTTSDVPGHAMKVTDYPRSQGAILGKAMSGLGTGKRGLVLVLVSLQ